MSNFQLWKKVIYLDQPFSVYWQLQELLWNDAVFQMANAVRSGSPIYLGKKVQVNPLIHHFIDQSYASFQLIAIRRLVDFYSLEGKKAVYSLYSVIKDMQTHHNLFTRRTLFNVAGLEYDAVRKIQQLHERSLNQPVFRQPRWLPTDEARLYQAVELHKALDHLSGTSANSRSENDVIKKEYFDMLLHKLGTRQVRELTEYASSYVAHASRATMKPISFNHASIRKAHEILCKTYNFVATNLLYGVPIFSPATAIFNLFEHLEKSFVDPEKKDALQLLWDQNYAEINEWKAWEFAS